jgi:hypothetical protein
MHHSVLRAWRKWLVRGFVFTVAATLVGAGLLYQRWTNPAATRQQVIDKLSSHFLLTRVTLEAARLRLLGGIALTDLRLARSDDPDKTDYLYVPSAVLYHDKEQLLQGVLEIRKIEMFRPRLRIARGPDGKWNLSGILTPADVNEHMPTLVIHQGTILLEDRLAAPNSVPVELKDVNLTVINDPLPTLVFEGTATADLAGGIHLKGTQDRKTERLALALAAPAVDIGPALVQRLSAYSLDAAVHTREFRGLLDLDADLVYDRSAPQPFSYDLRARLSQGQFSHALLPRPLEGIQGTLHCVDGRIPEAHLTAHAGQTQVELTARDLVPAASLDGVLGEVDLVVRHLDVSADLFKPLPPSLSDINTEFSPAGLANVTLTYRKAPNGVPHKHCVFRAEDMRASYEGFQYPAEHIRGTVEADIGDGREDTIKIDLVGQAAGQPVTLKGEVAGDRPYGVALEIQGKNLPLDRTLLHALPDKYQKLARSFHASGLGDFVATIHRERGGDHYDNRYLITFHDAALCYDVFPYPAENVTGILDIHPNDWEFHHFHGTHRGGQFWANGRCIPGAGGDKLEVHLTGTNVVLDEEMAKALAHGPEPSLEHTWKTFAPSGHIDFEGIIERPPGEKPDIDLTVFPRGCGIRPHFFEYTLSELVGRVHYAKRWVELDDLCARHGDSVLSLGTGTVYLKPDGGIWADLHDVRAKPLVPDGDFVEALPEALKKACTALAVRGPVGVDTRLVIDTDPDPLKLPIIYWDGWADLHDASFQTGVRVEHVTGQVACRGRHNGHHLEGVAGNLVLKDATLFGKQPLHDVHSQIEVSPDAPDVLRLPGLYARYCGGEVYGPAHVEFGPSLRYELKLTAARVRLEEFAQVNGFGPDVELNGLASASLFLSGQGTDLNTLKGAGTVSVPDGKLYNLPLLLDLLKVATLRAPDRTMFEEAEADFEIDGPHVHVNHVDLFGNAISLRGGGELNIDGSDINLDFRVDWARLPELLPGDLHKVPCAISDQLLKIKMRGRLGDIRCTPEAVPGLLDTFGRFLNSGRTGGGGNDE